MFMISRNHLKEQKEYKMLISIVTVCFNSEKTIRKTIESVLNQTYKNIEYIIVDGLSKDNTLSIVEEYSNAFKEKGITYKMISEKDNGIYDAMNKGIKLATGKFIALLNSDDWYESNAVETVVKTYEEEPFDMFYADIRIYKNDGSEMIKRSKHSKYATSRGWNHPTSFISKEIYDKMQYKATGIYDDFDLLLRIKKAGYKIVIKNEVIANFCFGGASNSKSFKACKQRFTDRYRAYRDNGYSRLYVFECFMMEAAKFILG